MAPPVTTEDYYKVLEVSQTATAHLIRKSYLRLALKFHPDRKGSKEGFQLLNQAYETLKDENRRQQYDLLYPFSTNPSSAQNTSRSFPSSSAAHPGASQEVAQIAALRTLKEERITRWRLTRSVLESAVFELQRSIRRLENSIDILASISTAEAAEDARKNSWGAWFLSQVSRQVHESEDDMARKDRQRQERRVEKDLKERQVEMLKAQLRDKENLLQQSERENRDADTRHDLAIRAIEARIREMKAREQQNSKAAEMEKTEKVRRQEQALQEKRAREARETWRKQQASAQTAPSPRNRQAERNDPTSSFNSGTPHQTPSSTCSHGGWWDKVQGHAAEKHVRGARSIYGPNSRLEQQKAVGKNRLDQDPLDCTSASVCPRTSPSGSVQGRTQMRILN
ncbi:hypothetical protein CBER1_11689 [Cercospora berteroae]|uniref:J domain-containing protein n=1 Tax=Cercospora berteroae TaxID=357750 RepID=A0A2S6CIM0_9PEZI|nr:hypothetical protein CBER1_11689 [Cercospora berteroae]